MKNILKLLGSLALCQIASFIGSVFTFHSVNTWYQTIRKPSFTPPNWVFGPVWTGLFLMMGIALFLVWKKESGLKTKALVAFIIQLVLNMAWSAAFFGLHSPLAGFVVIIILWIMILWTTVIFYRISGLAGILMIPYLLWVGFAGVLNWVIFRLNS